MAKIGSDQGNARSSNPQHADRYPRDIAVRVLTRVLGEGEPLDEALARVERELPGQARAWLQEVCSGTLRWKGRLDLALDSTALKKKPTGWLRKILLLAAYQLIAQERTHPGAVVSETVAEVRRREGEAPAKFANAILRKIAGHALSWRDLPFREEAPPAEAAAWASLPEWLWERIVRDRGLDWARSYALASLERPRLWIRGKRPDWKPTGETKPGPVLGAWVLAEGGSPQGSEGKRARVPEMAGFAEGEFFVQDVSSQMLVAEISGSVLGAAAAGGGGGSGSGSGSGAAGVSRALDLCAAPGGKAAGLAWNGFQVIATDRDQGRIALLRSTVERVAPEIQVLDRSAVAGLPPLDLVWVDAPCTGSGILRRHPDVRWLRRERELGPLTKLQTELLEEGWSKVRPGGYLAYSVCSVLREEGSERVEAAGLKGAVLKEWFLVPQEPPGGDGFWCALLRK